MRPPALYILWQQQQRRLRGGDCLDWRAMNPDKFYKLFRFHQDDFPQLVDALKLPETIRSKYSNFWATKEEAILLVLWRLAYPCRWVELEDMFGQPLPWMSTILNRTVDLLYNQYKILFEIDGRRLDRTCLQQFSDAIHRKTGALRTCVGFIDGTVRPNTWPSRHQKQVYNGHKRVHALKYQSVTTPDGIIIHLSGPFIGKRHDARILKESLLEEKMQPYTQFDDIQYIIYGDPAYPLKPWLVCGYKGSTLTPAEAEFNKRMSTACVSVEWGFGKVLQYFALTDFKKNMKILLRPIAKYYMVAALFTNIHTCMYGSVASLFFHVGPPSVDVYLETANAINPQ